VPSATSSPKMERIASCVISGVPSRYERTASTPVDLHKTRPCQQDGCRSLASHLRGSQHPFGHFVKGLVQMGRGRPVPVRGLSSYTHVPDRTRVLMVRMTHGVGIARRAVSDVCRVALLLQPSCLHLMLILLHNLKPAPHMSHERHPISKANERCASSSLVCSGRSKMD
jgi:hypothetical protein